LLPHGTVVTVLDGKSWTLFRNEGNEATPELTPMPLPALVETNHGSGGRHASSGGGADTHQLNEDAHVAAVAEWLNRQVADHKITHLVVIAPPRALGEVRHRYSKGTEQALLAELPKDLMGNSGSEIVAALRAKD
jgi:protein required for attachment to host cells